MKIRERRMETKMGNGIGTDRRRRGKRIGMILAATAVLGIGAGLLEMSGAKGESLPRRENGSGDYEETYYLTAEGVLENYSYCVKVPEQELTQSEEEQLLAQAREEIAEGFPGANDSVNHIEGSVFISDSYQSGKVTAEWQFDRQDIVDWQGTVIADSLPQEGILVEATAELACGSAQSRESFSFQVFPKQQTAEEELLSGLETYFAGKERAAGETTLELPEQIEGYSLIWEQKKEHLPGKILVLGGIAAVCTAFSEKEKERKRQKERKRKLQLEYPDMLSKLVLLLGAGMTVSGAWKRIAAAYEKKRQIRAVPEMPLYEEMLITCREMEGGVSEERAYEKFGERCGERKFRKLGHILTQNLRKGNRSLTALLTQEAEESYEERKSEARKYGEEAGTKLLLPMILMMGIILAILMIPAVLTFQI